MHDAAQRLAQAIRAVINEAVQAAVEGESPTPPPARVVERPNVPDEEIDLCPWRNKKHMRHLMPVKEAHLSTAAPSPGQQASTSIADASPILAMFPARGAHNRVAQLPGGECWMLRNRSWPYL
jgi:hypothetical protein